MRAVVLSSRDEPPHVMDVQVDPPRSGEVRVRVEAAGVCHSDLHVRNLEWDIPLPLVMGHEGAGVVTEVGPDVATLSEGDHVILCWQPACRRCRRCLAGRPSQCELVAEVVGPRGVLYDGTSRFRVDGQTAYHYIGVSSFSEETIVPETGAYTSDTDFVDSTSLIDAPFVTTVPTAGTWTNTTSPSASCA